MNESENTVPSPTPKVKLSIRDIVPGMRFRKAVTIRLIESNNFGKPMWLCQCDCGRQWPVVAAHLTSGNTKGCGCREDALTRFWNHVGKAVPDECWLWTGKGDNDGYGKLKVNGGSIKAHRFSWIITNGPIPDGLGVLHKCDNPPCVNPAHLFLGTNADNQADMIAKHRKVVNRGSAHHMAKLNDSDVRGIRSLRLLGKYHHEIAQSYGVSETLVSLILSGKRWSHLE